MYLANKTDSNYRSEMAVQSDYQAKSKFTHKN